MISACIRCRASVDIIISRAKFTYLIEQERLTCTPDLAIVFIVSGSVESCYNNFVCCYSRIRQIL